MRSTLFRLALSLVVLASYPAAPCHAQGVGVGARFSFVRGDVQADAASQRFTGGQIRAWISKRTALEVSLDRRSEGNELLTERVRDYPLQASLLLFPVHSTLSPYVLGGMGWYTHRVDRLTGTAVTASTTTRRAGSHAGFGAEMRLGRHAGLHADYRYTFLHFGADDSSKSGLTSARHGLLGTSGSSFLPSYEGSMWTAGLTVYF
jgi:hypothetical protein